VDAGGTATAGKIGAAIDWRSTIALDAIIEDVAEHVRAQARAAA
jgi:hypothetical protein